MRREEYKLDPEQPQPRHHHVERNHRRERPVIQRDPLHILYNCNDLTFYRTLISAAVGSYIQMVDPTVVTQAKSFSFFRNPIQKAYELLIPILVKHEPPFEAQSPAPKPSFFHGLSITISPATRELVARLTFDNGAGYRRAYIVRIVPSSDKIPQFIESIITPMDKPHPNLEPRL